VSRPKRIVAWSLAALLLIGATTWATQAIRHHLLYGTVFDETELRPRVEQGTRFSLAVPDKGASVGDEWSATVSSGDALLVAGDRQVMSNLFDRVFGPQVGGGAGTRYFTYVARRPGTVTVQLYNCFRGLCRSGLNDPWSRGVTWTITVG
jgi:inhibitor of cysteine peptidase